jgi:hypothetical protein
LSDDTNTGTKSGYDVQHEWLPCCDTRVRLHIRREEATHLHARTCKSCGRLWTFATERRQDTSTSWSHFTMIKLGKPTVPAVEEVLRDPEEDGWLPAHDRQGMMRLTKLIKAGQL